jgi:methionine synthase II (cobalamin-independent)
VTSSRYRADQVGSFLRPPALLAARSDMYEGRLDPDALAGLEDEAIVELLEHQKACGVDVFTDGEFRRPGFIAGFIEAVDGFVEGDPVHLPWKGGTGAEGESPNVRLVERPVTLKRRIAGAEASFMLEHSPGAVKITLPSPCLFSQMSWQEGVSDAAYPTRSDLVHDLTGLFAEEAEQLACDGIAYIQIDAPNYTHWADESLTAAYRAKGIDPDTFLEESIASDNVVLAPARSAGATTGIHLCRGNSMGRWLAEGAYDPIAEKLFTELRCDRLLLEYDSPRAGGFEPLRFVPDEKTVVLGLITTKSGALESRDQILRRIDEASRYVPIERLALSPQCGFASSGRGNPLTEDEQWRKLELVASIAREVWAE